MKDRRKMNRAIGSYRGYKICDNGDDFLIMSPQDWDGRSVVLCHETSVTAAVKTIDRLESARQVSIDFILEKLGYNQRLKPDNVVPFRRKNDHSGD